MLNLNKVFVFVFLIVAMISIHLIIQANIAHYGFSNDKTSKYLEETRSKNRSLTSVVARQETLKRIDKIARDRLGMVVPEKINYIYVKKDQLKKFKP